ncbi:MAG: single-stranded-DNA-specific exonuclease RecJ, partial [Candidatus Muirbacterium halophilum]|nr:single-stranded-DNA-specific exonuclease RecJ [Candidatus Muirbacterium halophilum]
GITSVAILSDFFEKLLDYTNVSYMLPDRDDGYGLRNLHIDKMKEENVKLLITVDCGICNVDEVKYAFSKGIEVIITDHHEIPEILPEAIAIINPKMPNQYPFKYLAGVGVAFKLIQAYVEKNNLDQSFYGKIIDLVALGTVADIVPLIDENRLITRNGLNFMKKHRRPGIEALMKYVYGDEINSRTISFGIAPRINASGRVGDPGVALRLLLTDDKENAKELASKLNEKNLERQNIEKDILKKAESMVALDKKNDSVILLSTEDWNIGVIGIVSSKLKDKFNRPAFLISIDEKTGIGKGSARSVNGFHLVEVMSKLSDLVEGYGGHEFAAGFSIKKENIELFHEKLAEFADIMLKDADTRPVIDIDIEIEPKDINISLFDDLFEKIFPFGEKNPFPVFCTKDIKVNSLVFFNLIHASMWLGDGFYNLKSVYYNFIKENSEKSISKGDIIDIVYTLKLSYMKKESFIELQIIDFVNKSKLDNGIDSGSYFIPDHIEKLKEKGNEYLYTGNFERAIEFYFKALKVEKNDSKIYFNIGLAYKKKGDKGKAYQYFVKAKNNCKGTDDVYKKACSNLQKLKTGV